MNSVPIPVLPQGTPPDEMADAMLRFVLWRIGEEPEGIRWSAGLALTCLAPPMADPLRAKVHRRLSSILSA
ncbi:hypothetical protein [Magnetospirillum moscoviense]|uniref:hypothetical protein n=1 Tax=Magnetospirillum moscoviense TaxID=1437059 RepID=UPI000AED9150|nr:hypothetical protein [Magnetospirillum moscoviense]MBF0324530.1 hypothetical protein [Alphaproteobacteria bacterium]